MEEMEGAEVKRLKQWLVQLKRKRLTSVNPKALCSRGRTGGDVREDAGAS